MTDSKKKNTLAQEFAEVEEKAREELKKLPTEEQEKLKKGQRSLLRKWNNQPWY